MGDFCDPGICGWRLSIAANSNYGITGKAGADGMGAAYRATGTKLNGDDYPARSSPLVRHMEGRARPLEAPTAPESRPMPPRGGAGDGFAGIGQALFGTPSGPGTVALPKSMRRYRAGPGMGVKISLQR